MDNKKKVDYASAGVNLAAGDEAVARIKKLANSTFNANVLSDIGSFGGLFKIPIAGYEEPVLVSSTDGVGTKLKLAFMSGIHNTVGHDIVNHCVNDILVQGARPLFFMDYLGLGKLESSILTGIIEGLSQACKDNDMPLLGGETAEMPGFYNPGEYDLVGAIVGIVDRKKIIDGSDIAESDVVLGLPSIGLHTNGYSLARKICFEMAGLKFSDQVEMIGNEIGKELLIPHRSYLQPISALMNDVPIAGMAHITGGGIPGNLIRIIPDNLKAVIQRIAWPNLPIFEYLQQAGGVSDSDMLDAFNMGIGYIIVVKEADAYKAESVLAENDQPSYRIGLIEKGEKAVEIA